jgi:nucleotide-binding universal stress UspA family protein
VSAPRCVAVGYDGSPEGTAALRWAVDNTDPAGRVVAVAALGSEPIPLPGGSRIAHVATRMTHDDRAFWTAWEIDAEAVGNDVELVVERGLPSEVLLRTATDQHADVLVVGRHRRRLGAVLPSVLRDLLQQTTIPIVIVP